MQLHRWLRNSTAKLNVGVLSKIKTCKVCKMSTFQNILTPGVAFVVQNFICHILQIHQESIFSVLVVWTWHLQLLYSSDILACVNVQSLDFLLKPLCRSDLCCHPVVVWTDTEAISHVHWYNASSIELKPAWIATSSHKNFPHNLNNLLPQFWSVLHIFSLGADIVGINCHFDPETCVKTVKLMKEGVEKAGLKAHYMSQPLAFHTPDCGRQGFIDLPEFPFGLYLL